MQRKQTLTGKLFGQPVKMARRAVVTAFAVLVGTFALESCDDGLLTGQPEWLGNSIYERMAEDGHYTTMLRLIDDLGQKPVLSQTGSKTLFVADDDAYQKWFQTNNWGVRSYEQLTTAQKKMLLNNSMVNNAYLIELLSNTYDSKIEPGTCMRRATALTIYDSVPRLLPKDMPKTVAWDKWRERPEGILLFKDGTAAPMIHFLPAYMQKNKITDEDLSILTNGGATTTNEAWVNGKKVVERDITCKNGYIQKVDGVIESAPNMAQILREHPKMSMWSQLIDRFSAPYYHENGSKEWNRMMNREDSVFTLRYYSEVSLGQERNIRRPDGKVVEATLNFDPGWNQYMYTNTMNRNMRYDAGAMIVPTNEALNAWWNADGKVLQDEYGTWDAVPDLVLSKLLNVNMLTSFAESVPSKFGSVVNDAKVTLGIQKEHVDSCFMGCNGVVYMVNRVFAPSAYSSVSFPALIHQNTMSVIYWAIDNLDFTPYLSSMDSYFSLILPSNNSLLMYVDPASYGEPQQVMFAFVFDEEDQRVKASRYSVTFLEDGTMEFGEQLDDATETAVSNRLNDLVNSLIIVGNVEDGHQYYRTKGGSVISVKNAGQEGRMTVSGGWQMEHETPITVQTIYDMSATGNGKSYVVDDQAPMGTQKSVYMTLRDNPDFSEFFKLISSGDPDSLDYNLMINTMGTGTKYYCADDKNNYNMRLFDNYNYTVYVPKNDVILDLQARGYLPTWDDYDAQTLEAWNGDEKAMKRAQYVIKNRIVNFLRYHIQDNSIFIGGQPTQLDENGKSPRYETSKLNPENKRFYSLQVTADDNNLSVVDQLGNVCHVLKQPGQYNNICREYWFSGTRLENKQIYSTSDAVVHLIDGALFYDANQMTQWKAEAGVH